MTTQNFAMADGRFAPEPTLTFSLSRYNSKGPQIWQKSNSDDGPRNGITRLVIAIELSNIPATK